MNTITNRNGKLSSIEGENAIDAYRIKVLISSIKLLQAGIRPNRSFTITYALSLATEYTGQKYKRNELEKAKEDLAKIMDLRLQHIEIVEG